MEHYDWNEGWLFTPRFDPALVRPECGLELEPVRIPHTVRVLPYNYCNEMNTSACAATGGSFLHPESGQAALFCSPLVLLPMTRPCSATGGGCSTMPAATPPSR